MQTLTLKIGGMTCGGCVKSVAKVLESLNGVEKAQVRLETGEAQVVFDETAVQPDGLVAAVEDAGFDAEAV